MYANDPDMAKKWEKEEVIRGKLRNIIRQEIKEDNIKFSKEEMAQLHKDGKVEKGGHTIEFNESTKEYGKTLDKIAKDRQLKSISKKDRDTLVKIAKLMKRANESTDFTPTMKKLAKSLGLKSVSQYLAGKGSLSYFLDDEREAKKLE